MEIAFKILLVIHVIAGSIGLFTGTINILRKKGDKNHKKVGLFFFYGMIINGFAGLMMSIMHLDYFLFIIAIFSIYMVGTAKRYLSLKELNNGQEPKIIDWLLTVLMFVFALGFIGFGTNLIYNSNNFGIVMIVFGMFSVLMVSQDIKCYKAKSKVVNYWLIIHIQRMIGAYIAALTAFLVVNNTILPGFVAWLLPTIILVPLSVYWSRKYKIIETK